MTVIGPGLDTPCSSLCFPGWEQFSLLAVILCSRMEIPLFYQQRDCHDDSRLWMAREDFLQEAVLSCLHLLKHYNTNTHNFHYFLVRTGVRAQVLCSI